MPTFFPPIAVTNFSSEKLFKKKLGLMLSQTVNKFESSWRKPCDYDQQPSEVARIKLALNK